MGLHQFAQPDMDKDDKKQDTRILNIRPLLRNQTTLIIQATAYMVPLINYGDIIRDEHCLLYGATLLGLPEPDYYSKICDIANFVGCEIMYPESET